jgi:rhamnogalacturonan endolyase
LGEFYKSDINVQAGSPISLGEVTWSVPHKGTKLAWQIGVPDRSAAKFKHGNDYYMPLLYQQLPHEFPNPLEYDVDKSDCAKDWGYAQSFALDNENHPVPAKWRIHFNLAAVPSGPATLNIALAGADRANLEVCVNNESTPLATVVPQIQGGNALVRESVHGKYCLQEVSIPASHLKEGANVITLIQGKVGGHVMYDSVSLELP